MPLTCSVGLSKKTGLPNYGSLAASCSVQFELDSTLLQTDLAAFQESVRNAYVACSQAVHEELTRQQKIPANRHDDPPARPSGNGSNGSRQNGHRATDKQLDYARQLAGHIKGLGVRRLDAVADQMFGKPVADLTTLDASGLIDTLKDIKSGKIDLASVLDGAES